MEDVGNGEIRPEWDIPKGGIKDGENEHQAIFRELDEEIGTSSISIERKLEYGMDYKFNMNGINYHQLTSLFLFRTEQKEFNPKTSEIMEANWFNVQDALEIVKYDTTKRLLEMVRDIEILHIL